MTMIRTNYFKKNAEKVVNEERISYEEPMVTGKRKACSLFR
jgi:tyrosine-protein phosphatase YwqE